MLQLIRVKDFDAAIAEANNTRFGLAASLVGGSPEMYDKFWANVRAGVINWNKPTNGAPSNAPFGGIGLSRQSPPERLLRRRLLRLSGDQQRGRPRPRRASARACATRTCRRTDAPPSGRGSLSRLAAFKRPMRNSKWIGTALEPCPVQRRPRLPARSSDNSARTRRVTSQPRARRRRRLELEDREAARDAIAEAPANGLKPELFLKGGRRRWRAALTAGGAQICLGAGQRLCRPDQAARGLHDPAPQGRRAPGPRSRRSRRATSNDWLEFARAADRRISRAEPGASSLSASSRRTDSSSRSRTASRSSPAASDPRVPAVAAALSARRLSRRPAQPQRASSSRAPPIARPLFARSWSPR